MLARYFPEKWVAMLDLDESPYAVSLQYACEVALTVIPHLVTGALDGEPVLLNGRARSGEPEARHTLRPGGSSCPTAKPTAAR